MFDPSLPKLLVLAVLALVVFGPMSCRRLPPRPAVPCATCGGSQTEPKPTCVARSALARVNISAHHS